MLVFSTINSIPTLCSLCKTTHYAGNYARLIATSLLLFLMELHLSMHCCVIFSYKHHMVMGMSQTVIIMLLQQFILDPNCEY